MDNDEIGKISMLFGKFTRGSLSGGNVGFTHGENARSAPARVCRTLKVCKPSAKFYRQSKGADKKVYVRMIEKQNHLSGSEVMLDLTVAQPT